MMRPKGRASLWLGLVVLLSAATAGAQCSASGRKPFVAGLEALNRGDLSAAAKAFYQLVEAQPRCAEARNNLAVVFVEQGRIDEAAQQLKQALQLRPNYRRARINLDRVEGLLKIQRDAGAQTQPTREPQASVAAPEMAAPPHVEDGGQTTVAESNQTQAEATPTEVTSASVQKTETPPADARPVGPPLPPGSAVGDVRNTAACVIDPAQNRLCVYQRTASALASSDCYPIAVAQVRAWPRWVVASEVSPKRIRLLDETGQTRLEIVAEDVAASGDVLRLRHEDVDALAAKVVPWRTGWLILE